MPVEVRSESFSSLSTRALHDRGLANVFKLTWRPSEALHRPSYLSLSIGSVKTIEKKIPYTRSHDTVKVIEIL